MTHSAAYFEGRITVTQVGSRLWELVAALAYCSPKFGRVRVPPGFLTDFASIPRPFWAILPPWDFQYSAAAVVHDRLYETQERSREDADMIFYEAMTTLGTPFWKKRIMYRAVRLGGWAAYESGPVRRAIRMDVARALHRGDREVTMAAILEKARRSGDHA